MLSDGRILVREILPNVVTPLLVEAAVAFAYAVLLESALSFLGLGAQPPEPSWGNMLNTGRGFMAQRLDHVVVIERVAEAVHARGLIARLGDE